MVIAPDACWEKMELLKTYIITKDSRSDCAELSLCVTVCLSSNRIGHRPNCQLNSDIEVGTANVSMRPLTKLGGIMLFDCFA